MTKRERLAKCPSPIFRRSGLKVVVGLALTSAVLFIGLGDIALKKSLEKIGTDLNGAQVDIGYLHTQIFDRSIEIGQLQISHHTNPMKNLLEVDRIKFSFLLEPLLRRKLIISDLAVKGIHYGTSRKNSGQIEFDPDAPAPPTSFIDRVAYGLYSGIRQKLNDNPLKYLGPLPMAINLKGKMPTFKDGLHAETRLKEAQTKLDALEPTWTALIKDLPPKDYFTSAFKQIEEASQSSTHTSRQLSDMIALKEEMLKKEEMLSMELNKIKGESAPLFDEIQNFDVVLGEDVERARKQMGLPSIESEDLTPQIFGPKILAYLERLSYWIDLGRRQMPKGDSHGPIALTIQHRGNETSVHFGKFAGNPTFLIQHATFTSDISEDETQGHVQGTLDGFTSDPVIYGRPMKASMDLDFPTYGFHGVHFEMEMDHTKNEYQEQVQFSIQSFPMSRWVISELTDLNLNVATAMADLDFKAVFKENEMNTNWKIGLRDAEFTVNSPYKSAELRLQELLTSYRSLDLHGSVQGTFNHLSFEASSNLGKGLATELQEEFRHELGAIDDHLKRELLGRLEPQRDALKYRLMDLRDKSFVRFEQSLKSTQDLEHLASLTIDRLQGRNKHPSRKTSSSREVSDNQ